MSRDRMPIAMPSRIWESCQNPSNRLHGTERIAILMSQTFIVSRNPERLYDVACTGAYRRGKVVTRGRSDRNKANGESCQDQGGHPPWPIGQTRTPSAPFPRSMPFQSAPHTSSGASLHCINQDRSSAPANETIEIAGILRWKGPENQITLLTTPSWATNLSLSRPILPSRTLAFSTNRLLSN